MAHVCFIVNKLFIRFLFLSNGLLRVPAPKKETILGIFPKCFGNWATLRPFPPRGGKILKKMVPVNFICFIIVAAFKL